MIKYARMHNQCNGSLNFFTTNMYIEEYYAQHDLACQNSDLDESYSIEDYVSSEDSSEEIISLDIPSYLIHRLDSRRSCYVTIRLPKIIPTNFRCLQINQCSFEIDHDYFAHCKMNHVIKMNMMTHLNTTILRHTLLQRVECESYTMLENDRLICLSANDVHLKCSSLHLRLIQCDRLTCDFDIAKTNIHFLDIKYPFEIQDKLHNVPCLTIRNIKFTTLDYVPKRVQFLRIIGKQVKISDKVRKQCRICMCDSRHRFANSNYVFWK